MLLGLFPENEGASFLKNTDLSMQIVYNRNAQLLIEPLYLFMPINNQEE